MAFFALLLWAGCIWASVEVGKDKGRFGEGLVLTIVLGPIGLLILFVLPPTQDAAPRHHIPMTAAVNQQNLPGLRRPESVSERLRVLDSLRQQGLITDEEAQARRVEILKEL